MLIAQSIDIEIYGLLLKLALMLSCYYLLRYSVDNEKYIKRLLISSAIVLLFALFLNSFTYSREYSETLTDITGGVIYGSIVL